MKGSPKSVSAPVRTRRWRVPPPLTRGGEMLEGAEILRELSGELSVLLWKSLRSVTLWTSATPREQAELFSEGAQRRRMAELLAVEIDPELVEPLRVFADLLGSPEEGRRPAVALACRQVATWARARKLSGTALAFTQAAALAAPGDAEMAHQVGRLARKQGEHARAESWHRRAIMLGRQTGAWDAYARSYVSLGNLAAQRGNFPLARRCHLKAYRAARRHNLGEVQAMALHDLFFVALETESAASAQRFARQAFRAYGPRHPRVPHLAHDLCCLWIREGQFALALSVLEALLPHFASEDERMLALANVARAAGAVGKTAVFHQASAETQRLAALGTTTHRAAQALLNLARGATGLLLWDQAEAAAQQALELAQSRMEGQIVFEAEAILDCVRSHRALADTATEVLEATEAEQIVEELLRALETVGAGGG